jgi:hypothetical protein
VAGVAEAFDSALGVSAGEGSSSAGEIEAPGGGDFKCFRRGPGEMGRTGSDNLFFVFPRVEEGVGEAFSGVGVPAAASGVSVGDGVALADGATEASGDEEADAFGDAVGEAYRFFLAVGEALGDGVFCGVGDALCRFRGFGVGCVKKFFTLAPNDSSSS